MNKTTKRSHYLPRTYLKHFLLNNALFMYKKGKNFFKENTDVQSRIVEIKGERGLINVGLENNLYQIVAPSINTDDIEEIFQKYGEDFLDDVIAEIEKYQTGDLISKEIKDKLCIFIASMRVRTPLFKWETEEMASVFTKHITAERMRVATIEELKRAMDSEEKNYTEEQIKSARQALIDKKYDLKWPNTLFLKFALSSLEVHADIFHKMNLVILRSRPDRYFITSDNPVVYFVPQNKVNFYNPPRSLMSPYTEVFFPLTRNLAVHLARIKRKEILMEANREITDLFNYNISHNSFNFIFSPLKMKSLEQFIVEYVPYPFRITMR